MIKKNSVNWWNVGLLFLVVVLLLALGIRSAAQTHDEIQEMWQGSPHADAESPSFTHWNGDGQIPEHCAACHSSGGFKDFIGEDKTARGVVDKAHPAGTVIECTVCHNDTAERITEVTFPSGVIIGDLNGSPQCMICHQGRASTISVNKKLASLSEDVVDGSLSFINVHYRAAAATLYGSETKGGYEYQNKEYVGRFLHAPQMDTCVSCHNAHSLEVETASCALCHSGEIADIRTTPTNFDGDNSLSEGISHEINEFHRRLAIAIYDYGKQIAKSPVVYSSAHYPYFFNDLDGNREGDDSEATYPNRYLNWTPRLLKAAYNYQFIAADPGAYAHNPMYALQLLYDSLADLAEEIEIDMDSLSRP